MNDIDWTRDAINIRDINKVEQRPEAPVDREISRVLGMPIRTNDPRLIRFVAGWKRDHGSSADSERMDFFLRDEMFIKELKKAFNG